MERFDVHPTYLGGYAELLDRIMLQTNTINDYLDEYGKSNSHYSGLLETLRPVVNKVADKYIDHLVTTAARIGGTEHELIASAYAYTGSDVLPGNQGAPVETGSSSGTPDGYLAAFPGSTRFPALTPITLTPPEYEKVDMSGETDLGGVLGILDDVCNHFTGHRPFSALLQDAAGNPGALEYTSSAVNIFAGAVHDSGGDLTNNLPLLRKNWHGKAAVSFAEFNKELFDYYHKLEPLALAWAGTLDTLVELWKMVAMGVTAIAEKAQSAITKHKLVKWIPFVGEAVTAYDIATGTIGLLKESSSAYEALKGLIENTKQIGEAIADQLEKDAKKTSDKDKKLLSEGLDHDMKKLGKISVLSKIAEPLAEAETTYVEEVGSQLPAIIAESGEDLPDNFQLGTPEGRAS